MSTRFLRAILALYPRSFRRRYGREMQDLVNDIRASSDRSGLWLASELLTGAVAERLQAVRPHARLMIPTLAVVAALGATIGFHWSRGGQRFPRAIANAGIYVQPTTKLPTRLGSVDAPTGQPTPPRNAAGWLPVPNEGSNSPSQ